MNSERTQTFKNMRKKRRERTLVRRKSVRSLLVALCLVLLAASAMHFSNTTSKGDVQNTPYPSRHDDGDRSSEVIGISADELARRIRAAMARYQHVEIDQELRARRGPDLYHRLIREESCVRKMTRLDSPPPLAQDSNSIPPRKGASDPTTLAPVKAVRVRFVTMSHELDATVRMFRLAAALAGVPVEVIAQDWPHFSFLRKLFPIQGLFASVRESDGAKGTLSLLENGTTDVMSQHPQWLDSDVVVFLDSDVFFTGTRDFLPFLRAFASVTAHSEEEHLMIVPPIQRNRSSTRNSSAGRCAETLNGTCPELAVRRYVRDIRTDAAMSPVLCAGEFNLLHTGALATAGQSYITVDEMMRQWLKEQTIQEARDSTMHKTGVETHSSEKHFSSSYTFASHARSRAPHLNSGVVVARVWALRRLLNTANALLAAIATPSPPHSTSFVETSNRTNPRVANASSPAAGEKSGHAPGLPPLRSWPLADDQGAIGMLYIQIRLREFDVGGPLELSEGSREAQWLTRRWKPFHNTAFDFPATETSRRRIIADALADVPHGLLAVDTSGLMVALASDLLARRARFTSSGSRDGVLQLEKVPVMEAGGLWGNRRGHAAVSLPLEPSFLGNKVLAGLGADPTESSLYCRGSSPGALINCSSCSFLSDLALLPSRRSRRSGRLVSEGPIPFLWHFAGSNKYVHMRNLLRLTPSLFPLLPHSSLWGEKDTGQWSARTAEQYRVADRLLELLPLPPLWSLAGPCRGLPSAPSPGNMENAIAQAGCNAVPLPAADVRRRWREASAGQSNARSGELDWILEQLQRQSLGRRIYI